MEQLIFLGFVVLYGIGVGLFRFARWVGRRITAVNTGPNPIQQAIAEASRQQAQTPPLSRPPLAAPTRPRPRQPDAGGSAVPQEATREGLEAREQELFAAEDAPGAEPPGTVMTGTDAPPALFGSTDDLVRAIILREVLGPPLSRRGR